MDLNEAAKTGRVHIRAREGEKSPRVTLGWSNGKGVFNRDLEGVQEVYFRWKDGKAVAVIEVEAELDVQLHGGRVEFRTPDGREV